ncbi:MAG: nicotinamide-nucleotide amidohydrolase family protein [Bacteroidota bacterium]
MTKIALLNIGSELLIGRTVNTNASEMGKMLRREGYGVATTLVIHDEGSTIRKSLDDLLLGHDVVICTGGLGPTRDDITKKTLLERFGGEMVCHEPTLKAIEAYLAMRDRTLLESNRMQAFVPSSCEVLMNEMGSAPGMLFREKGEVREKAVISLPGVPFEMKHLMARKVIPFLRDNYPAKAVLTRIVRTAGVPESRIAERMEDLEAEMPEGLSVAYLPSFDGTKIELRMEGEESDRGEMERQIEIKQKRIANLFSKYTYSLEDQTPDQVLAELILRENLTMGTAESCTGGGIAAKMVQNSGISKALKGGIVAYMREVKEQLLSVDPRMIDEKGIVSEEVARAMAEGARQVLASDFAVSITGWAEAARDAAPEDRAQAWIGFADGKGSVAFHLKLFKSRPVNLEVAANAAIIFALRCVRQRILKR